MRDIETYAQNYQVSSFEDYQVIYRRKKVLEVMKQFAPKRILEIGCGLEPLFSYMDEKEYEIYCVVEPSKVFFERACTLAKGKNVICYNTFFEPTEELVSKRFDFIICSGLLHELERPQELIEDVYKISDSNTVVHFNVPNAKSLHRLIAKEMGLISNEFEFSGRNVQYQQHSVYDLDMLVKSIKKAGFQIIDSGSYFIKPFSHSQMYQMLNENIIDEKVLDGLYQLEKYIPEYGSEIFVNCRI